jgi:hypothetical protein
MLWEPATRAEVEIDAEFRVFDPPPFTTLELPSSVEPS